MDPEKLAHVDSSIPPSVPDSPDLHVNCFTGMHKHSTAVSKSELRRGYTLELEDLIQLLYVHVALLGSFLRSANRSLRKYQSGNVPKRATYLEC